MDLRNEPNIGETQPEKNNANYLSRQPQSRSSMPIIIGILLLISGGLSILFWVQFFTLDATTLGSFIDISQLQQIDPTITIERLLGFLSTCAIIGCVIAVFPILGGILAFKKKMWSISLATSIIGLFSLGFLFTSSLLSFIAMILLIIYRKEFQ